MASSEASEPVEVFAADPHDDRDIDNPPLVHRQFLFHPTAGPKGLQKLFDEAGVWEV